MKSKLLTGVLIILQDGCGASKGDGAREVRNRRAAMAALLHDPGPNSFKGYRPQYPRQLVTMIKSHNHTNTVKKL